MLCHHLDLLCCQLELLRRQFWRDVSTCIHNVPINHICTAKRHSCACHQLDVLCHQLDMPYPIALNDIWKVLVHAEIWWNTSNAPQIRLTQHSTEWRSQSTPTVAMKTAIIISLTYANDQSFLFVSRGKNGHTCAQHTLLSQQTHPSNALVLSASTKQHCYFGD